MDSVVLRWSTEDFHMNWTTLQAAAKMHEYTAAVLCRELVMKDLGMSPLYMIPVNITTILISVLLSRLELVVLGCTGTKIRDVTVVLWISNEYSKPTGCMCA